MLSQINLTHFKCFESLKLQLRPLTLLSGQNACGKSATIQALVLLNQTMRDNEWSSQLILNGSVIRLGTAADVIDQVYGRHSCGIELLGENRSYSWAFDGEQDDMALKIASVSIDDVLQPIEDAFQYLVPYSSGPFIWGNRFKRMTYLQAERLGPRDIYPMDNIEENSHVVGPGGEHAVNILFSRRDTKTPDLLTNANAPPRLFSQVELTMRSFFPGFRFELNKLDRVNSVTLGLRTSNSTDYLRPINTGFGLTQILPVVVAALSAKPDDLLLIENPEVHMHPAGQANIGVFLAKVAAAGIQVIIETHSDHVLNGIRRAVKERVLPSESVALHFFRPRSEDYDDEIAQVQTPEIDSEGNVEFWPEGFFDQFDIDMNYFAYWD